MTNNGFHKYGNFINPIIYSIIVSALLCVLAGQNSLKAQEKFSTITGTVVDTNSNPLVGATILAYPTKQGATSDTYGNFIISKISQGQYKLKVNAIGYARVETTIVVDKESHVINFKVIDDIPKPIDYVYVLGKSKIVGNVTDVNSHPVTGVNIFVTSTTSGATSDSNGKFVIPYIHQGKFNLRTSAIGYNQKDTTIIVNHDSVYLKLELTPLPPSCDLRLPTNNLSTIVGIVTDQSDGKPITGANILIMSTINGATTDSNGFFKIGGISTGSRTYTLKCLCPRFQTQEKSIVVHQYEAYVNFSLGPDFGEPMITVEPDGKELRKALNTFESDSILGCVMVIIPYKIDTEPFDYSKQYGFLFRTNDWSQLFMDEYNRKALSFLERRNGKEFLTTLNELQHKFEKNK